MSFNNNERDKLYIEKINEVKKLINEAEAIVVGIGAGMSASGGINYGDPELVKRWFPEYYAKGFRGLMEIQSVFWNLSDKNVLGYWGYWARHIDYIRYKSELLEPYKNLCKILEDKNYFICTTNADGQVQKAGFSKDKIFAPQGNYDSFQCIIPCNNEEIFYNKTMIENMVKSINDKYEIDSDTVPRCPNCGEYLIPNLRCDDKFVEKPHMRTIKAYEDFINNNIDKNILFIELGVGFNTPVIIRYPFERITYNARKAKLIRVNKGMAEVPREIEDKSITLDFDISEVIKDIMK